MKKGGDKGKKRKEKKRARGPRHQRSRLHLPTRTILRMKPVTRMRRYMITGRRMLKNPRRNVKMMTSQLNRVRRLLQSFVLMILTGVQMNVLWYVPMNSRIQDHC